MNALSDQTTSPQDLVNQWFGLRSSWKRMLLVLGIIILMAVFCLFACFLMCLYCCSGICLQYSQLAAKEAISTLGKPLQTTQGTLRRRGAYKIVRALHEVLEEVMETMSYLVDLWAGPRKFKDLYPDSPLSLEYKFYLPFPLGALFSRTQP